jgi:hypothetical protein
MPNGVCKVTKSPPPPVFGLLHGAISDIINGGLDAHQYHRNLFIPHRRTSSTTHSHPIASPRTLHLPTFPSPALGSGSRTFLTLKAPQLLLVPWPTSKRTKSSPKTVPCIEKPFEPGCSHGRQVSRLANSHTAQIPWEFRDGGIPNRGTRAGIIGT